MHFLSVKIKSSWTVITFAILVGLTYSSHHFFISQDLEKRGFDYQPVTISGNRDEAAFYGQRARAVFEGQLVAGDISVAHNEDSPSLLPMLNPLLLGGLGRILGSLERAFIASDFLFPALIFLALYILAKELTGRKPLSLLFAVIFVFIPKVFLALPPITPGIFHDFLSAISPDSENLPYFSRFEYPKITFLFFTLAFYFVFRSLKRREKYSVLLAGLSSGALFYTYLYDWVYFFIGLAFLAVIFLFSKDYSRVKQILAIVGIGLILSIPYWINFLELLSLPHYGDLADRLGSELGRHFRFATAWKSYLRSSGLAILIWFLWRRRDRLLADFLLGFLAVIFVVLNLQIVLGFNPQPDHWHRIQFLTIGLSFLALGFWLYERYLNHDAHKRMFSWITAIFAAAIFASSFYSQYAFSAVQAGKFTLPKDKDLSYRWLKEKTPKGSVVGSLSILNSELPLYSHNKIFSPNGFNTTIADAEILERFMITARIFGLSIEEFKKLLSEPDMVLYLFHDKYRDRSFGSYFRNSGHALPKEVLNQAALKYEEILALPISELVGKYQLDYLYFDERETNAYNDPALAIPDIQKVYEEESIKIYEVYPQT